ncbi:hypothetical protein D7X55_01430 [Corallococcus sp. AB049A]|uniref:Lipoprotein n=1 Tax=Corallococcus interemptor TaxID=2316720 RepID=A0A3A8Q5J8_9BACT|nr:MULTISPECIES: hypothetical protein [Corallococcus]RKH52921.1 hypothetical protein D7Y23_05470 [Corallococcus sp. AB050B]RKH63949.1 hypothetical protein D7X96_26755 [Corallococcus interemptor]RKI74866.1 hypothetical protein D7X55_01430 [Corallococcus sp. AB049A]
MNFISRALVLGSLSTLVGCATTKGGTKTPDTTEPTPASLVEHCDDTQKAISKEADAMASPYGIDQHIAKNFPDRRVSWLMTDSAYQKFVVQTGAKNFGRCNDTACYLFAAPSAAIHGAVEKSKTADGKHDPAVLGQALGLPAKNFEGPLRMMTLDLGAQKICTRLPVDADPGVWKCQTPEDTDCFKFGGYTSGGAPEVMVINAPVADTQVAEIP